ncbi:unnamed protein product [Symbiodinium sp. CCMP2592]|nr:unnamed protein product [Symbiodinium sp. CCMP2592]
MLPPHLDPHDKPLADDDRHDGRHVAAPLRDSTIGAKVAKRKLAPSVTALKRMKLAQAAEAAEDLRAAGGGGEHEADGAASEESPHWTPVRSKEDRAARPGLLIFPVTSPAGDASAGSEPKAPDHDHVHTRREQLKLQPAPKAKGKAKAKAKAKASARAPSPHENSAEPSMPSSADAGRGARPSVSEEGSDGKAKGKGPSGGRGRGKGGRGRGGRGGRGKGKGPSESGHEGGKGGAEGADLEPENRKGKGKGKKGSTGASTRVTPSEVMDVLQEDDLMMRMTLELKDAMNLPPEEIPSIEDQRKVKRYEHWRLSMYWTRNTVGVLRLHGPRTQPTYCGTLAAGGSDNIAVAQEAADQFDGIGSKLLGTDSELFGIQITWMGGDSSELRYALTSTDASTMRRMLGDAAKYAKILKNHEDAGGSLGDL